MITLKALEQIFERMCDEDPRVRMFRIADVWQQNTTTNEFPLVMFEVLDSGIAVIDRGGKRNTYNIRLACLDQRLQDWSNVSDALSNTHIILNDLFLRFTGERAIQNLGIVFDNKTYPIKPALWKNNDIFIGNYIDISFSAPSLICLDDLPVSPLGTINTSCYSCGGSGEHALTCSTLVDCPTIQDIYAQIAAISGATGSFDCNDLLGCTLFTNLSAQTQSLSAITSLHTTQITELQGLTGASTYVQPGLNVFTAGTANAPVVGVIGSPSFTSVTASNFISGATNLSSIFAPASVQNQWLQNGTNITTGGTPNAPSANLVASPSVTNLVASGVVFGGTLSGNTIFSGATNLSSLFAPASVFNTFVQPGLNISTGGTAFSPIINTLGTVVFTGMTSSVGQFTTSLTLTSAAVAVGQTTYTGDVTKPTNHNNGVFTYDTSVLLVGRDSIFSAASNAARVVSNVIVEAAAGLLATGNIRATANISGATFYSGSSELGSLFAGSTPTYVQPGLNITTGGTITRPIVNLAGSISLTAVTATDEIRGRTIVGTTSISGASVTATTLVSTTGTITTLNSTTGNITTLVSTTASASGNLSGGTVFEGSTSLVNKYAPKDLTVTLNSGTYILALTDDSRLVDLSGASAQNCVVPRNSAVALPIGAQVMVVQTGAGQVTFSADTGVTLLSYLSQTKLAGQYAAASLVKKDTNTWVIAGNLTT